jgi:Mn2+/Fe2+ NRAMP family transporter
MTNGKKIFTAVGPGILVAATGVGAGDLATATFTGTKLGVAVLWVVLLGAFFKFILNEGLTRWQLVTGSTFLEGAMHHLGRPGQYIFLVYLLVWSFMVAAALMSACGVALHAIFPLFSDPAMGKIVYGIICSLVGMWLIRLGGYCLFERIMKICIGCMFVTVMVTAVLLRPSWVELITGLFVPTIPELGGEGLSWTIALMGGVGGTVTVLCYGYWIREEGRFNASDLRVCRIDLAIAYAMTALFGVAMVVIGSTIQVEGTGVTLMVRLSDRLGEQIGVVGKWTFLIGAFGAVFSSLLGVWQSVPYLFVDVWRLIWKNQPSSQGMISTSSRSYRWYLYAMSIIPMIGLWIGFASMQKFYAIVGALFMPMLSFTLLILNGRSKWIGTSFQNKPATSFFLVMVLLFFLVAGGLMVS